MIRNYPFLPSKKRGQMGRMAQEGARVSSSEVSRGTNIGF